MASAEIAGVVELGQWCTVPGGFEIFVEPIPSNIRKVHVRVRPKPPRASKVKHRRLQPPIRAQLTDDPPS